MNITHCILAAITASICLVLVALTKQSITKNQKEAKEFILRYKYLLHPNAISIGGTVLVLMAMVFYYLEFPRLTIVLFLVGAFSDALDGIVARTASLVTELGKELDPLCDKLKCLIPLLLFAYFFTYQAGEELSKKLVWALLVIDLLNQLSRRIAKLINQKTRFKLTIAANDFGKAKTALALLLVMGHLLVQPGSAILSWANPLLIVVVAFAVASFLRKFRFASTKLPTAA